MTPRRLTVVVIWSAVVGLCGYDLWALNAAGTDATISQVIIDANAEWPIIGVVAGILIGHLFWQMKGKK